VCGYNRKYAIRKLSSRIQLKTKPSRNIGRPMVYYGKAIEAYIQNVWKKTNLICSKRLIVPLREWLEFYEEEKEVERLTEEDKSLLRQISPSTIDRLLASHRNRYQKRGLSTTKQDSIIRTQIPLKTNHIPASPEC